MYYFILIYFLLRVIFGGFSLAVYIFSHEKTGFMFLLL